MLQKRVYQDIVVKIHEFIKPDGFVEISLKGKNVKRLLQDKGFILNQIRQLHQNSYIHLDLSRRKIELRGPKEILMQVEEELGKHIKEIEILADTHKETCEICFDNIIDVYKLNQCGHKFCCNCLYLKVKSAESDNTHFPIACPKCLTNIELVDIRNFCDIETLKRLCTLSYNVYLSSKRNEYQNCFTPNCENIFMIRDYYDDFKCDVCKKHYCVSCKRPYHRGYNCFQVEDIDIISVMKKLGYKHCPNPECRVVTEKIIGCDHILCTLCKIHFCWTCASPEAMFKTQGECYAHMRTAHNWGVL